MKRGMYWMHHCIPRRCRGTLLTYGAVQCPLGALSCRTLLPQIPSVIRHHSNECPPNWYMMHPARWMSHRTTPETSEESSTLADNGHRQNTDSVEESPPLSQGTKAVASESNTSVAPKRATLYPYPDYDRDIRERDPIPTPKLPPLPRQEAVKSNHYVLPEKRDVDLAKFLALQERTRQVEETVSTGKNSYLQADFCEQPYLQALHDMTQTIPHRLDEALEIRRQRGNKPPLQHIPAAYITKQFQSSPKWKEFRWLHDFIYPKTKRPALVGIMLPHLQIVPRPVSQLHCTLFFGGRALCALPNDDLRKWHEIVSRRLERSGFLLDGNDWPEHVTAHMPEDYWFHVKELACYPPPRKNLIVAHLEASRAWHHLWWDLREIAFKDTPGLEKFMNFPAQRRLERWIPHITLADISFTLEGKRIEEQILRKVLLDWPVESFDFVENIKCVSISMGGPVPQPKSERDASPEPELDWNFLFQDIRRGSR
jgi:hypothetical protein